MNYDRFGQVKSTKDTENHRTILNFDQEDEDDRENNIRATLLRESGHLIRSEQLIDEQYDIALRAREELINQRSIIRSMQDQYNNVTGKFQLVNSVIKKIYIRRRRETIILAIVFSICLGFLIYNII